MALAESLPGEPVYRNERIPAGLFSAPGQGAFFADDLTLSEPFGCNAVYYDLLVSGCEPSVSGCTSDRFDVRAELWNDNPCEGGTPIEGTEAHWTDIPADGGLYPLQHTLDRPIGVPGSVWLRVGFSTDAGGWVIAERAEIGETDNLFSLEVPEAEPPVCGLFYFGPGPPFPFGGFWANLRCEFGPPVLGACCGGGTCSITTEFECPGVWRGEGTDCDPNPCGASFVIYSNSFRTGTFRPIEENTQVSDDVTFAKGAIPCHLSQYEIGVTGRTGTAAFSVRTELWSNDPGPDGIVSVDDLPLLPIPGTSRAFAGVRADNTTHGLVAGPFPGGLLLPEKVWLVISTSTPDSGPNTAGLAEVGGSADAYAVYSGGIWTGGQSFGGFDPTGCPGGAACVPAGSFRVRVLCYGEQAAGACCESEQDSCADEVFLRHCEGRSLPGECCSNASFEPPCGASLCPHGDLELFDPPNGVVDARQPHDVESASLKQGVRTLSVYSPSGAASSCFGLCEGDEACATNRVVGVVEESPGIYSINLEHPLAPGAATILLYAGSPSASQLIAHPGNVNGDGVVSPLDVQSLIACLNSGGSPVACPWGFPYGVDIDQDGVASPLDLVRLVDLLNGADAFVPMRDSLLPSGPCP